MNEIDESIDITVALKPKIEKFYDLQWNNHEEIFLKRVNEIISKNGKLIQIIYEEKEFKTPILKELKANLPNLFFVRSYDELENCIKTRLNQESTINIILDETIDPFMSYKQLHENLIKFELLKSSLRHYNVNIFWLVPEIQERNWIEYYLMIKFYKEINAYEKAKENLENRFIYKCEKCGFEFSLNRNAEFIITTCKDCKTTSRFKKIDDE